MRKTKRNQYRTRLWVEELESRWVPSLATVSSNWAGYAVQSNLTKPANDYFTAVTGSWTVPAVTGTAGVVDYSSVWIGLDGYTSTTVEQIGTESDWNGKTATYYAWYEMYPRNSVTVTKLTVNPNDSISASVTFAAGEFDLTITDNTTSASFSTKQALAGAKRSSAEWVVEAPSNGTGVLPLANFGTTTITDATATATIGGKATTGPIDSSSWQSASMTMQSQGGVTEATTSGLVDSGNSSSFSVSYAAPPVTTPTPVTSHHHWWWWSMNEMAELAPMGGLVPTYVPRADAGPVAPTPQPTQPLVHPAKPINVAPLTMAMAFGLGADWAQGDDANAPLPGIGGPMTPTAPAPNSDLPPGAIPPAAPSDSGALVESGTARTAIVVPDRSDVPAERRELRPRNIGKALLALAGFAGVITLRRDDDTKNKRNHESHP